MNHFPKVDANEDYILHDVIEGEFVNRLFTFIPRIIR